MAVSFIATGITAGSDVATPFANLSYTLPTGHTTGDLLIAFYGGKPYNTVPSTPTDYTAQSGGANGTTAMGAGTGSVYAVAFAKTHDGSESNPASTFSAQYSPGVRAMLAIRSAGSTWTVTSCKGSDATSTSTTYSATGDATLDFTTGDIIVVSLVHNDDSSSDSSFEITVPGCTVGTVTQRLTGTLTTSTGNDARMYVLTAKIESGTASGAPTVTATTGSGDSDGQSVFLRVQGADWTIYPTFKRNNAEDQTSGTTLTGSNAGTAPNTNFQYTGNVLFSNAQAFTGTNSFKFPGSTDAYIDWEHPDRTNGGKQMAWRCYLYIPTLDTASNRSYFTFYSLAASIRVNLWLDPSNHYWHVDTPGGTLDGSVSMQAATWYRIECQAEIGTTTSNGYVAFQVYDSSGTLVESISSSSANLSTDQFGEMWVTATGHTQDFYVDDLHLTWDSRTPPDGWVSPPDATVTVAAVAPTVTAAGGGATATVPDPAGVTVAAPTPTVTGVRNATVTAVPATVAVAARTATVTGGATVTATRAPVTIAAVAPVVTAVRVATVTATVATATVAAPAPAITATRFATVTVPPAQVTTAGPTPGVTGGAAVTAVPATASVAAPAPAVTATAAATVSAVPATAAVAAPAPSAAVTVSVAVTASPAAVSVAAVGDVYDPGYGGGYASTPTVTGGATVTVPDPAAATAAAPAPAVTATVSATVTAVPATVTAAAAAPAATGGATVAPPDATVAVAAPAPVVGSEQDATVSAAPATVSVAAPAPAITAIRSATVTAVPAAASAAATAPAVTATRFATVTATPATATVTVAAPVVVGTIGVTVSAVAATVTATAVVPALAAGATLAPLTATLTVAAVSPTVTGGAAVAVVAATLTIQTVAPEVSPNRVHAATVTITAIRPFVWVRIARVHMTGYDQPRTAAVGGAAAARMTAANTSDGTTIAGTTGAATALTGTAGAATMTRGADDGDL